MRSPSPVEIFASAADWAECRRTLRVGSRTFHAASQLLPPAVRQSALGLYGFCRVADDAIDLGGANRAGSDRDGMGVVAALGHRLDHIYAGTPDDSAIDRAFADVVRRHDIPREYPDALLEGFAWDSMNRRYDTLADLSEYAMRVAGMVGAMLSMVMGVRDRDLLARACDLGIAMQYTNIARDVGEDQRCGRLYLPREWLREEGIDCDFQIREGATGLVFSEGLARVIRRLLEAAEALYLRSDDGLARLPFDCRAGMTAARLMYAEIGRELARRGFDSVSRRVVVPWPTKARIAAGALLTSRKPPLSERMVSVFELFARLNRLDQHERSARIAPDLSAL